ncbi:MAG TPA: hypothetical protein DC054_05905 [Blastocatellia bacterium]|nr:hypothetical protein [Blastocatellia bacterium]
MARSVAGVIVGYLVMFILQFAAFMTIYTVMGANWSFKPGSFHASTRWTVMQFTVILVTAVIGGLICALISKGGKAPLVLAVVALAIGFTLGALHVATQPADTHELRTESVTEHRSDDQSEASGVGNLRGSDYRGDWYWYRRKIEAAFLISEKQRWLDRLLLLSRVMSRCSCWHSLGSLAHISS